MKKWLGCILLTLAVLLVGCSRTDEHSNQVRPKLNVQISGTVRYPATVQHPNGMVVYNAKVMTVIARVGFVAWSDTLGRYALTVPASPDSITVHGEDGYTPNIFYGVIHYTNIRVCPDRDRRRVELVLDHSTPF